MNERPRLSLDRKMPWPIQISEYKMKWFRQVINRKERTGVKGDMAVTVIP